VGWGEEGVVGEEGAAEDEEGDEEGFHGHAESQRVVGRREW
jgi:hypothetical protein